MRERLLLEYHNSPLGGHLGREKTIEKLEADYWWPGLAADVKTWCKRCSACQKAKGQSKKTAWTRTEVYSRPFRVLQFDTIGKMNKAGEVTGAQYVLTVVDCFSRFSWLIPLVELSNEAVGTALLKHVLLDLACFPVIIRSDQHTSLVGGVVQYINDFIGIKHVVGSSWHPQSQGIDERSHRTVNAVVRTLITEHASDWESKLPFAQFALRVLPKRVLGNRSPYEVVTGLKPKMPTNILSGLAPRSVTIDDYAKDLVESLSGVYNDIRRAQIERAQQDRDKAEGKKNDDYEVGGLVLLKRAVPAGQPARFADRTYDRYYRIKRKIDNNTVVIEDAVEPEAPLPIEYDHINIDRLIKLDVPQTVLEPGPRRLEVQDDADLDKWHSGRIQEMAIDGRVKIRFDSQPANPEWLDLSERKYRWLVDHSALASRKRLGVKTRVSTPVEAGTTGEDA